MLQGQGLAPILIAHFDFSWSINRERFEMTGSRSKGADPRYGLCLGWKTETQSSNQRDDLRSATDPATLTPGCRPRDQPNIQPTNRSTKYTRSCQHSELSNSDGVPLHGTTVELTRWRKWLCSCNRQQNVIFEEFRGQLYFGMLSSITDRYC